MSPTDHIEKKYWTIGQLADELNEKPSAIRFWESQFKIHIHRNKNGERRYSVGDVARIKEIHFLIRIEKYTFEGVKQKLENYVA